MEDFFNLQAAGWDDPERGKKVERFRHLAETGATRLRFFPGSEYAFPEFVAGARPSYRFARLGQLAGGKDGHAAAFVSPAFPGAGEKVEKDKKAGGQSPVFSTLMKASCGMLIFPMDFMRFLPSFCFSRSLRLRVTSPP